MPSKKQRERYRYTADLISIRTGLSFLSKALESSHKHAIKRLDRIILRLEKLKEKPYSTRRVESVG